MRTAPGARKVGPDDTDELRESSILGVKAGETGSNGRGRLKVIMGGGATHIILTFRSSLPKPGAFVVSPRLPLGETAEDASGTRPFLQNISCGTRPGRVRGRFSQYQVHKCWWGRDSLRM
eukprot:gene18073-biopygen23398